VKETLNERDLDFHTVLGIVRLTVADGGLTFENGSSKFLIDGNFSQWCKPSSLVVNRRRLANVAVGGAEYDKRVNFRVALFNCLEDQGGGNPAERPAGVRNNTCYDSFRQRLYNGRFIETLVYFVEALVLPARIELACHNGLSFLHNTPTDIDKRLAFTVARRYDYTTMRQLNKSIVAVIMGSDSDLAIMQTCIDTLKDFGIKPVVRIISAHRTPKEAAQFAQSAAQKGIKVIIAAAGMAAHLAGSIAAQTTLPVIGVPLAAKEGLSGLDSLLSTVQMPSGVPVATVAIGRAGAKNAAILAVQILGLSDKKLSVKLARHKAAQAKEVAQKNAQIK
jgi:phosphoribosylaminoimidazole carboxylase PurE protein